MTRTLAALAAALLTSTAVLAADKVEIGRSEVKGWEVSAYQHATGQFSHCNIMNTFTGEQSSDRVSIGMAQGIEATVEMFFVNTDWRVTEGKQVAIKMVYDTGSEFTGTGYVASASSVRIRFEPSKNFFLHFMQARSVKLYFNSKGIGNFTLNGSAAAFGALQDCRDAGASLSSSRGESF